MGSADDGGEPRAVFPIDDEHEGAEPLEAVAEEEDVACIPCLPAPYQSTRSEYLDHCVTHYPFRAWCRHCLEGRGREFGHDCQSGNKEPSAAPVVSFVGLSCWLFMFAAALVESTLLKTVLQQVVSGYLLAIPWWVASAPSWSDRSHTISG